MDTMIVAGRQAPSDKVGPQARDGSPCQASARRKSWTSVKGVYLLWTRHVAKPELAGSPRGDGQASISSMGRP